jgi:hypothetical protein
VFSHGWGEDSDGTINGGLQLSSGDWGDKTKQVSADDFLDERIKGLGNRFADGADVYFNACRTARGTLPQTMADTYNVTVYGYKQSLKFFETAKVYGHPLTLSSVKIPYDGPTGRILQNSIVEMSPSIGYKGFAFALPIGPKKYTPSSSTMDSRYSRIK